MSGTAPDTAPRSDETVVESDTTTTSPPVERPGALPYLVVADPRRAIDWYTSILGAVLRGEPIVMDDGRIGHAELEMEGGVIYLAAEFPDLGLRAPEYRQGLGEPDAPRGRHRRRRRSRRPRRSRGHPRAVRGARNPHRRRRRPVRPSLDADRSVREQGRRRDRSGDIGYMALSTPDAARARRFYATVLGWEFDADGRRVTNVGHRLGIHETDGPPTLFCAYAVHDLEAAHARIVAAGGHGEPDGVRTVAASSTPSTIRECDSPSIRSNPVTPAPSSSRTAGVR